MLDESILKTLQLSFGTAIQRIYIESLGKEYSFREASFKETKDLSKITISNKDSPSVIYAMTLAMMKMLCLEEDFDPYKISEFDRLKIIIHLFSNNFFSKNISMKCPVKACNHSFSYSMKYGTMLKCLDSVDCSDITFENKTDFGHIHITANFPNTKRYLNLLELSDSESTKKKLQSIKDSAISEYGLMDNSFSEIDRNEKNKNVIISADDDAVAKIRKRREFLKNKINKSNSENKGVFGNIDIKYSSYDKDSILDLADIYIKRIRIDGIAGSENEFDIDFSDLTYDETEKVLSSIPMKLFVMEDGTDVIKYVTRKIFEKMNKCVPLIKCEKCGYEISKRLTIQNFFIFG